MTWRYCSSPTKQGGDPLILVPNPKSVEKVAVCCVLPRGMKVPRELTSVLYAVFIQYNTIRLGTGGWSR